MHTGKGLAIEPVRASGFCLLVIYTETTRHDTFVRARISKTVVSTFLLDEGRWPVKIFYLIGDA